MRKLAATLLLPLLAGVIMAFTAEEGFPRLLDRELARVWGHGFPDRQPMEGSDSICRVNGFNGRFLVLRDSEGQQRKYAWQGRVPTCGQGGCAVAGPENPASDFEYFDYFILFNEDASVASVRVYDYRATYGHEICSRAWLSQFTDYRGAGLLRPGKEIDAISGATVSVNAISFDVSEKARILRNWLF